MFEKFKEYMNKNGIEITKTGDDGEETFHFSLNNWTCYGIIILIGIAIFV